MDAPDVGTHRRVSVRRPFTTLLEELGIERRASRFACDNPGYFDEIDAPDKAYWLGFIGADGCVTGFNQRLSAPPDQTGPQGS